MFDQSTITAGPTCSQTATHELRVAWASSSPAGTTFQVYLDRRLAWSGSATVARLPIPAGPSRVWVGAVAAGEERTDFSASLTDPLGAGDRASLAWQGGRWQSPDLAGFRVYSGASPGSMPDLSGPYATVGATTAGLWLDGAGMGGAGMGGAGSASISYRWTSGPLPAGTWHFAVAPVDSAGNVGAPSACSATIAGPPRPPATLGPGKGRLALAYVAAGRVVTLTWNPSPP